MPFGENAGILNNLFCFLIRKIMEYSENLDFPGKKMIIF